MSSAQDTGPRRGAGPRRHRHRRHSGCRRRGRPARPHRRARQQRRPHPGRCPEKTTLEETTEQELRYLFELHSFGPAALTKAVLPHMRRHGGGAVVQMSSVAGQVTAPGFGAYCATKFALEGLTETLSQEVDFGVRFLIVEPSAFRTGLFAAGSAYQSTAMPEYAATVGPTRQYVSSGDGTQPGDPAKAAAAILTALAAENTPLRLPLGDDAVERIRAHLAPVGDEVAAWELLSRATSFDPA